MRQVITPLKSRGFLNLFRSCLAIFALVLAVAPIMVPAAAAEDAARLPLMFDARERLARPDISAVVRVRILTTVDFPPFAFADQTGRLSGFNVDLAREICAELKLEAKCQIQALPFDELEKALESGAGEAVMAGMAVTPDLRRRFLFSRPYLGIPARFARNRSAATMNGDTAAALAGRSVGVVNGTAHEAMLKAFFPDIVATPFDSYEAMLDAVKSAKVEAVFADGLRLPFWVVGEASENCCALFDGPYLSEKYLGEGLSVMIRKGDPVLVAAFDQALAELSRNGRLQEIYLRYFPNGLY
jgi:polar amino acid transport system substrate-binding protein